MAANTYPLRRRLHRTSLVSRLIPHSSVGESKGLQFDNDLQFLSSNGPSSTAAWVWMTAAAGPDQHLIVVDQTAADADDGGIGLFFNFDGDLEYRITRVTADQAREAVGIAVAANLGRWIHVCGTWGGNPIFAGLPNIYVDGVLTNDTSFNGSGATVDAPGSHSVGGREATQNRGLGGYIAGVGRWNHELSADEVRALAEGTHPLDMHPEKLLLCPDFATGENLAPRYMQNPTPNLWEWDADGIWEPPPALRLPSSQQQILFGAAPPGPTQADVYPLRHSELITKPQTRPTIDWQHPLSNGLVFCAPMVGVAQIYSDADDGEIGFDLVAEKMPTVEISGPGPNTIEDRTAEYLGVSQIGAHSRLRGRALNIEPNIVQAIDDAGLDYGVDDRFQLQELTVITACYAVAETSFGSRVLSHARANSDNYGLAVINTELRFRANAVSLDITPTGGVTGKLWFMAGTNNPDGNTTIRAWRPGTGEVFTGTGTGQTISYTDDRGMRIGYNEAGNVRGFDGEIYFAYVWDRVLDEAEIDAIFENPWQLLESPARPLLISSPVGEDITGTLAETLGDATSVGTGELEAEGTLAVTLGDSTPTTAGELEVESTLAETLDDTTPTTTGELEVEGTLSELLGDSTSTTTGELEIEGTLAEVLENTVSATSGELEIEGTLNEILDDTVSAASGEIFFQATLAETLDGATSVGTGELEVEASLAETLDDATSVGEGSVGFEGTLSETLDDVTISADGEIFFEASLAETLDDTTSAASGELEVEGTLAETLDNATVVASGSTGFEGTLAETLEDATSTASGELEAEGTLAETLDNAVSVGTGEIFFEGALSETLEDTTSVGAGEISFEGSLAEVLEDAVSTSAGELEVEGILAETLDNATGLAQGQTGEDIDATLAETLDDVASTIAGELTIEGSASITLGDAILTGAGEGQIVGALGQTLDDVTGASLGELEAEGSLSELLDNATSVIDGFIGEDVDGTIIITLDDVTLVGVGLLTGAVADIDEAALIGRHVDVNALIARDWSDEAEITRVLEVDELITRTHESDVTV